MYSTKSKGYNTKNSRYVRENIETISQEYLNNTGLTELSKKYNVAPSTIKKALIDYGVKLRTRSEVKRLEDIKNPCLGNGRKYTLNFDYFKTWSREMAYIVGFIGADGNISKYNRLKITLQEQDKQILDDISKALSYSGEINSITIKLNGKVYKACELSIVSKYLAQSLIDIGITPRKSFTLSMSLIPNEYKLDFIRGYFDGDGSIGEQWAKRSKTPCMRVRFATGSETLAYEIVEELEKYGVKRVNISKSKDSQIYNIEYSQKASKKIYELFYKDATIFLQRKKDKFDSIIKKQTI